MKTNEKTNQTKKLIRLYLTKQGGYGWLQNTFGLPGAEHARAAKKKGVADLLCVFPFYVHPINRKIGIAIAIEVKTGKDVLSIEQDGFLENFRHAGGLTFVTADMPDFQKQWEETLKSLAYINLNPWIPTNQETVES